MIVGIPIVFNECCFINNEKERRGKHKLSGATKIENTPARLLISVYNRINKQYIISRFSNPVDGKWSISCIPEQGDRACMVIAQDFGVDGGAHNAQIFDYVSQYDPNPLSVIEEATSEGAE